MDKQNHLLYQKTMVYYREYPLRKLSLPTMLKGIKLLLKITITSVYCLLCASCSVRQSAFQDPANFCLWNPESWAMDIRNSAQGTWNSANNCNPANPSSTGNESRIQDLQFLIYTVKTRFGLTCMGRMVTVLNINSCFYLDSKTKK